MKVYKTKCPKNISKKKTKFKYKISYNCDDLYYLIRVEQNCMFKVTCMHVYKKHLLKASVVNDYIVYYYQNTC